jgi:pyrroline-5-carboxylate reductase
MAEAIIKGILKEKLVGPEDIIASDIDAARVEMLAETYGVHPTTDNTEAARDSQILVLAVKPQVLPHVLPGLKGVLTDQLLLSIVAGAKIATLVAGLNHDAIVRVMPNTPAQIGAGISVWTETQAVTESQHEQAAAILEALGEQIYVADEHYLDMATAVNGSGPAYIFLILEAFIDAAVHLGFARPMARKLVMQTMLGSVRFAQALPETHLAELRNSVTSPGGTTAEALYEMESGGLRAILDRAIMASYAKSVKLGEE